MKHKVLKKFCENGSLLPSFCTVGHLKNPQGRTFSYFWIFDFLLKMTTFSQKITHIELNFLLLVFLLILQLSFSQNLPKKWKQTHLSKIGAKNRQKEIWALIITVSSGNPLSTSFRTNVGLPLWKTCDDVSMFKHGKI